jgi:hydrogenase-4 component E
VKQSLSPEFCIPHNSNPDYCSNYYSIKFIKDTNLDKTYFVVALSTLFTGLYLIVSRKKIITHVIGYIVIENGVFILSLAVGNEMLCWLIWVFLDIFASVLILGVFFNKIGDVLKDPDVNLLRNLKD